jgi:hypothetical protein
MIIQWDVIDTVLNQVNLMLILFIRSATYQLAIQLLYS